MTPYQNDPNFILRPSRPRLLVSLASQGLLGVLLIYTAISTPPAALLWQVFLLGLGLLALVGAARSWSAMDQAIVLTEAGLFDQTGQPIAPLADIDTVDRSLFGFRPSNGFLVRMKSPHPRAWKPGVWWRIGRRVGVGGVLPSAQTKFVADTLAAMCAERTP